MNPYFIIIPEGHNFGKVYTLKDGQWYNVSSKGTLYRVEIIHGGCS